MRSYKAVAKILGKSYSWTEKKAREMCWAERTEAWDNEVDRRIQAAELSEIERMVKRQVGLSLGMQEAATYELQALVNRIKLAEKVAQQTRQVRRPFTSVRDIVRLVECGTKLERLNRGEPDSIVETRPVPENLDALDVNELELYRELLAKMRGLQR